MLPILRNQWNEIHDDDRRVPSGGEFGIDIPFVGTVPFVLTRGRPAIDKVPAALGAMALRLAVVLILAVAVVLTGLVAKKALLIWVAVSHFGLLIADTLFASAELKDAASDESGV